jgi:hypothetical protein
LRRDPGGFSEGCSFLFLNKKDMEKRESVWMDRGGRDGGDRGSLLLVIYINN